MKGIWGIPLVAALLVLLSSCTQSTFQTDREAQTVAEAIGYPRQGSAAGYARAALDTALGKSGGLSVLEYHDIHPNGPQDVSAHLVFRIHHDAADPNESVASAGPVTTCYAVDFNYYGLANGPERIDCPAHATAITPPPASPPAQIPGTFDQPLHAILAALPAEPTRQDVLDALARGMPTVQPDPTTHLTGPAPVLYVAVRGGDTNVGTGADVGVAYRTVDSTDQVDCLLGARISGKVLVWRPSWQQVQPGELICDALDALHRQGTTPPH